MVAGPKGLLMSVRREGKEGTSEERQLLAVHNCIGQQSNDEKTEKEVTC